MSKILQEMGFRQWLTTQYILNWNSVAEQKNKMPVEATQSMLIHSPLTRFFWAEAIGSTNYMKNRSLIASLENGTSQGTWFGISTNLIYLQIFGCKVLKEWWNRVIGMCVGYSEYARTYQMPLWEQRKSLCLRTWRITLIRSVKSELFRPSQILVHHHRIKMKNRINPPLLDKVDWETSKIELQWNWKTSSKRIKSRGLFAKISHKKKRLVPRSISNNVEVTHKLQRKK